MELLFPLSIVHFMFISCSFHFSLGMKEKQPISNPFLFYCSDIDRVGNCLGYT